MMAKKIAFGQVSLMLTFPILGLRVALLGWRRLLACASLHLVLLLTILVL